MEDQSSTEEILNYENCVKSYKNFKHSWGTPTIDIRTLSEHYTTSIQTLKIIS